MEREDQRISTYRGDTMRVYYTFPVLSPVERERMEAMLLEELHLQGWYAVVYSAPLGGELILPIQ